MFFDPGGVLIDLWGKVNQTNIAESDGMLHKSESSFGSPYGNHWNRKYAGLAYYMLVNLSRFNTYNYFLIIFFLLYVKASFCFVVA